METINNLLSNSIGYVDALRHAEPFSPPTAPITPNVLPSIPTRGNKISYWQYAAWTIIIVAVGYGIYHFAIRKPQVNQDENAMGN